MIAEVTPLSQGLMLGVFALLTVIYTTLSKRKDTRLAVIADREKEERTARLEAEKEDRQAARLDAVAFEARETARLLAASTEAMAARAALNAAKLDVLERHQERIEASQDIVHAMLNSAQTTQMLAYIVTLKSTRAALRTQHTQLKELFALRSSTDELNAEQKNELNALQEQIMALGLEIATNQDAVDDRVREQELAESKNRNQTKLADAATVVAEAAKQPIVIDQASITVGQQLLTQQEHQDDDDDDQK